VRRLVVTVLVGCAPGLRVDRVRVPAGEVLLGPGPETHARELAMCVEGGESPAGCERRIGRELPARRVAVPAFSIDRREVTFEEYGRCAAAGACAPLDLPACETLGVEGLPSAAALAGPRLPVVCVSEAMAAAYCAWARGALPTEAQWERAAEGDVERLFPWGDDWRPAALNWGDGGAADGHLHTAPVGSYPSGAGPYGALDQAGNVWEWTSDRFGDDDTKRVTRGGGFAARSTAFTTNHRAPQDRGRRTVNIGFRCVGG
jgi:formylglycine-generating enzyme required for sulfatase activity